MINACFTPLKQNHINNCSKQPIVNFNKFMSLVSKGGDDTSYREVYKNILKKITLEKRKYESNTYYIIIFRKILRKWSIKKKGNSSLNSFSRKY